MRGRTKLIDLFPGEKPEVWRTRVLSEQPSLVAFSLYAWNRTDMLALARRLRSDRPDLHLVAGGPEATADPEGVLAEGGLDAVIRGEGEGPFRNLVETLAREKRLTPLPGVTLRTPEGIAAGGDAPPADPLDSLASPWLTGVLRPGEGVLWEIARGCPFGCDFCFDARGTKGVRHLSRDRLAAELDLFVSAGVAQIWVLDSTFNFLPERGKALLQLIGSKASHIHCRTRRSACPNRWVS
jgi:radical SAM superfamily enzyme YgiQ (UPF0313 family)